MTSRGQQRQLPFQNGVKPIHAAVLVICLLVKLTYGGVDPQASRVSRSASESGGHGHAAGHGHDGNGHHDAGPELHPQQIQRELQEEKEGHGHGHGYQVFHMEFERVELPFIIALWIFVSSLAKIGMVD